MRRNEPRQPVLARRSDADPGLPAGVVAHARLRVDGVEGVVVGDEQPADAAELHVGVEQLAVLAEDLNSVVAPVGHEQASLRIHLQGVGGAELAGPEPDLAPLFDERAVGGELQDAAGGAGRRIGALPAVAVRDEDVAVRRGDHVARLVELTGAAAGLAGDAQAQQLFALGAELDDLMALGARLVALRVGHPDVAVGVDVDAVRQHEQAGAEAGHHLAGVLVELEDGVAVGILLAAPGQGQPPAAVVGPDVAVRSDVDARRRAPLPPVGQRRPVQNHLAGRIRQRAIDPVALAVLGGGGRGGRERECGCRERHGGACRHLSRLAHACSPRPVETAGRPGRPPSTYAFTPRKTRHRSAPTAA